MRTKMLGGGCVAMMAALTLAVSATAGVPGTLTLAQTYPVATSLCAKATAGTLPPRLEQNRGAVESVCTTLANGFTHLVTAVTGVESQYTQTLANESAAVAAACPTPLTAADRPACHAARVQAQLTDAQARLTRRDVVETYRNGVEANRLAFWSTIASLRNSSSATTTS